MKKKRIYIPLIIILSLGIIYGILFYFNFFQGFVYSKDSKIISKTIQKQRFTSNYSPSNTFDDMPISKISDVKINILGEEFISSSPVLLKAQRYYLPIESLAKTLNYSFNEDNSEINLSNSLTNINISENKCKLNNSNYSLRGNIIKENDISYLSLSDIEYLFNLVCIFNFDNNSINLVNNSKEQPINSSVDANSKKKIALIRLEDFSAGDSMLIDSYQAEMKAMGNLLYSNGIKFHIAWVPRFKAPSENIDNDLLNNNCIQNVGFINLLDYLINSGGEVGLHGYTHQSDDQRSLNGTELSRKYNSSDKETREVIENAINTSVALNIPCSFFESPHYKATLNQKKIIEEYFEFIYEPYNPLIYHKLYSTKNNNLYIPTPLSYVRDLNVDYILKGLSNPRPGLLASLFYHPTKEFDFIEINTENNTFNITYSEDSPIYKIINKLNECNYKTTHVSELKN